MNKMRIVIVNPPHTTPIIREGRCQSPQNMRRTSIPQMTLAYLAGVLHKAGHSLRVFDCIASNMTAESFLLEMRDFDPRLAIINTTTPSINSDITFISDFKKQFPRCFMTAFGVHVTALHEEMLAKIPDLDCVIRHEPERPALELSSALEKDFLPEQGIPGCTLRNKGSVIIGAERPYDADLDGLGFPAWEYFDSANYLHPIFNKPYVMVNTSRGCAHNCIFCVASLFYGKKVRYRSVTSVIDEIESHVIAKFGIRHIWMYADDFTCSPDFVKDLCRTIINRKLKITWWSNTRVDKPDPEMFRLMREAGCFMLSIGGESGNAQILNTIRKGTKPEYIKNTVDLLRKTGINSLVYFLIGLPGETRETIRETIEFAKKINPDYVEFYPATPYPGTRFYEIAAGDGLIVKTSWNDYLCGGNEFVIQIPGVTKNELDMILREAYRKFYVRPAYAAIFLKKALKPSEFIRLVQFGFGYIGRFFSKA